MFPLTPAIAIDAGNSNLHVSNGAIETNASPDAGHGSGDLALYAISLHCSGEVKMNLLVGKGIWGGLRC